MFKPGSIARNGLSPKTLERYPEIAVRQIAPHLGSHPLQKLKPEHVRAWHSTLIGGGLSARSVGHAHRLLHKVLACAVANATLTRNVAGVHKPPKVEDKEIEILSPEQIADVRGKLADHPLLPIVELALATGARRGELLGLQWGDLDMDAAMLRRKVGRGNPRRVAAQVAKDTARAAYPEGATGNRRHATCP
jgi:integrase